MRDTTTAPAVLGNRNLVRWLCVSLVMLLLVLSLPGWAVAKEARAEVERIDPLIHQGQLSMDIDVDLRLSASMIEALERGVALSFTLIVNIEEPRWWWFNKTLVDAQLTRRIAFNTLTRQWRVSIGDLGLIVGTFEEAIDIVQRVRGWDVAPLDRFELNTHYNGQVRIMLDTTQLSRPMQLDASNRSDWNLVSPWRHFEFSVDRHQEKKP